MSVRETGLRVRDEVLERDEPIASGIVDFHLHSGPSLHPRHTADPETCRAARAAGIELFVLKAHEGSSVERADLLGESVLGGVVLNSPVGGANPDAVRIAAMLGGRVVWMPTLSSTAHHRAAGTSELSVHAGLNFAPVPVTGAGKLLPQWFDVLDQIAARDMVLVAGHLSIDETVLLFTHARKRGVQRMLVNHPGLKFLGWRTEHARQLRKLGAYLEVGVLCDLIAGSTGLRTEHFAAQYPEELLVFGSDLGHAEYPSIGEGLRRWWNATESAVGARTLTRILTVNGRELVIR